MSDTTREALAAAIDLHHDALSEDELIDGIAASMLLTDAMIQSGVQGDTGVYVVHEDDVVVLARDALVAILASDWLSAHVAAVVAERTSEFQRLLDITYGERDEARERAACMERSRDNVLEVAERDRSDARLAVAGERERIARAREWIVACVDPAVVGVDRKRAMLDHLHPLTPGPVPDDLSTIARTSTEGGETGE